MSVRHVRRGASSRVSALRVAHADRISVLVSRIYARASDRLGTSAPRPAGRHHRVATAPHANTTALSLGLILSASSLLGHAFHHPTPHKPRDLPNPFPQELSIYRPLQLKQASPLMAAPVALRHSPVRSACSPAPQIRGVKRRVSILCTPFFPHLQRKHLLF